MALKSIDLFLSSAKDIWLDEGNDLIRSCGALSKVLGLQRSFSCGDILTIQDSVPVRHTQSDVLLVECDKYPQVRLDTQSSSISAWIVDESGTAKESIQEPRYDDFVIVFLIISNWISHSFI